MERVTYTFKNHFWNALDRLQFDLNEQYNSNLVQGVHKKELESNHQCNRNNDVSPKALTKHPVPLSENFENIKQKIDLSCIRADVLSKIEAYASDIILKLSNGEAPFLSFYSGTQKDNSRYDDQSGMCVAVTAKPTVIKFGSQSSVLHFASLVKILEIIYQLVNDGSFSTKRDIYYENVTLFGKQSRVDSLVACASSLLQVPRWHLNILATSKGCVCGNLSFYESGKYISCSNKQAVMLPSHISSMENIRTDARFVLVIEKDATLQKLIDQNFCEKLQPCLLVTGKGFPDINTRMFLCRLWMEFHLPMFALVDADPHGIEILSIYKFGSRTLSQESSHLAIPSIKWLGILPSDIYKFNLPDDKIMELTELDRRKANSILARKYIQANPTWKAEIELMQRCGKKADIQGLTALSTSYLTDIYIPGKLQYAGWI